MTMIDKHRQIKYYEELFEKYGDNYLSLDWKSPDSQEKRFKILTDLIDMYYGSKKTSVIDVGCGFGDLSNYLEKKGYKASYLGYDITPKILDAAKSKYPKAKFELNDILEDENPKKADFVFCCGALNIVFDSREKHMQFINSMLIRMFQLCNIAVGVNFLSYQAVYHLQDEELNLAQYFYTRIEDILSCVRGMTSRFIIRHDYHPGDFTVYLMKK